MPLEGRAYVNSCTKHGLPLILFVEVFRKIGSSSQMQEEVGSVEVRAEEGVESIDGQNEEDNEDGVEGGDAEDEDAIREPNGEADEGEYIPRLVEQVEREGEEANGAMDDDSSDEDDAGYRSM
ncbi:hypothetical protein SEVIR_9G242955v4 [Setaria viridis]